MQGWSGGAIVLGTFLVVGRPTNLDNSRARGCCACSRCRGGGLFGHFSSLLSFLFYFTLFLGDGPIKTEILSHRPLSPNQSTSQPKSTRVKMGVSSSEADS